MLLVSRRAELVTGDDRHRPEGFADELDAASKDRGVQVVAEDGAAPPAAVLAALWGEWILSSARSAPSAALASAPLDPYPHQMTAVYEKMYLLWRPAVATAAAGGAAAVAASVWVAFDGGAVGALPARSSQRRDRQGKRAPELPQDAR